MTFWNNKKVLAVGGAGFIGSHTVDALIADGARVAIVDNLSTGKRAHCHPAASFYELDACSVPGITEVFAKEHPDFVMHFAAVVDIPYSISHPMESTPGIAATVNLLEHCVKFGVKKVLYASSGFIYGNPKTIPTPEVEPAQPLNPYNISKAASENYCRFFHAHHGLPFVALRYAPVYGPRRTIGPIVDYIRKISNGQRAEIYGQKTRDYTYVSDVVHANLLAMEADLGGGEPVFNIGTGQDIALDEIYALIARILERADCDAIRKPGKASEVERSCLDISCATQAFGYRPQVTFRQGLQQTIEWVLKDQGANRQCIS